MAKASSDTDRWLVKVYSGELSVSKRRLKLLLSFSFPVKKQINNILHSDRLGELDNCCEATRHNRQYLIEKLKSVLISEYKKNFDSRTIIFVKTRELTVALENYMKEDEDLKQLHPCRLVSINVSSQSAGNLCSYFYSNHFGVCFFSNGAACNFRFTRYLGQSQSDQDVILKSFQSGDKKVMIATTVAEEGLDIEKCNLIVKYNHVTNEIAMVQRRGRGRAAGSKSILLTQEHKIAEKERTNQIREKLMQMAIEKVRTYDEAKFSTEILKRQLIDYRERSMSRLFSETKKQRLENKR